jgi:4-diphosphocytidyl-2-C-methyl-D-erythritol kinase
VETAAAAEPADDRSTVSIDGPCVQVRVPGKINLFLAVRGSRADGFHELVTIMQTVSLFDRLRVGLSGPPGQGHHPAARRRMRLELLHEPTEGLPDPEANLAVRAARALGAATGVIDSQTGAERSLGGPATVLELDKQIPIAGGMAGGSADAAAALVALNRLWGCELSRDDLRRLAAKIGSDVPFCVVGGTALATGRGTAVAQVLCRGTFHWVVGIDARPLSTAEVYRAWDRRSRPSVIEPDAVLHALRSQDAEALGAALHNDLEVAAFHLRPELADRRDAILEAGALGAVLSGSGPTMLGLAASAGEANRIADAVAGHFSRVIVARSPAGGPEVSPC